MVKFLAVVNVLLWSVFLWLDAAWNGFQAEAIAKKQGIYEGDWFGPLSFVRPKVLALAYAVTLLLAFLIFRKRDETTDVAAGSN